MQWNSVSEFVSMGGYALYVWGSFGITAAVMVAEMVEIRYQRIQLLRNLGGNAQNGGEAS